MTVAVVAVTLCLSYVVLFSPRGQGPTSRVIDGWETHRDSGIRSGPESAAAQFAVFMDFTCPHSRALIPVLESLRERYPQEVSITWFHFPIAGREGAREATQVVECARRGLGFDPVLAAFSDSEPDVPPEVVLGELIAESDVIQDCAGGATELDIIATHRHIGLLTGLLGTPYVWLNGQVFFGRSLEDFADATNVAVENLM